MTLMKIFKFLSILLFFIIDFFIILIFKPVPKNKETLIIQPDGIGDFIVWLDAAKEFKNVLHNNKIVLLCNKNCVEIIDKLKYFDEIIPFDFMKFKFNIFHRISVLKNIRKRGYDKVINIRYEREFAISESMVHVSGASNRIGYFRKPLNTVLNLLMKISDRYYTNLIKVPDNLIILERNAAFIKQLGTGDFNCSMPVLPNYLLPPNYLDMKQKKYYVLFPGASGSFKRWPIERFAAIASQIYKETGWTGVIFGDSNENFLGEYLLKNIKDVPLINMIGKTSLLEMASIMKESALVVTSDTCAVHIASAVGTPSVVVILITSYVSFFSKIHNIEGRIKPFCLFHKMNCPKIICFDCPQTVDLNCKECVSKNSVNNVAPCIENVPVDAVWRKVSSIINTY